MKVGLGKDYSVKEYYQATAKVVVFKGVFKHDLTKPADMKRKLTDVSLMKKFGWQPRTTLEDGIRLTVDFYRKKFVESANKIVITCT